MSESPIKEDTKIKTLSLFDGISCARAALDRAGFDVQKYYASEVDKYAIQVAQKNYPDTIQLGDVRGITKDVVWDIDLLIWWSPCQDLSIAKRGRKGLDGERSWLFREYVRILEEMQPKRFVLENVASMSKESKDIISNALWVEPIMIDAALVSAQRRKRLFRTNISWVGRPEDRGTVLSDILENYVENRYDINISERYWTKGLCSIDWKSKSLTASCRKGYGNDGITIIQRPGGYNKGWEYHDKSPTLTSNSRQENNKLSQYWVIRKLTPIECERLQWLPDNYTEWLSNTQRYKCLGNAFNVDVVAHILSFIPR